MAFRLASLVVDIATKGFEVVKDNLKQIERGLKLASVAMTGFVTAGLAGTTMGERFRVQMQMLMREIAATFLPILQKISGALQLAINWFRELTRAQQESIGKWGAIAIGGMLFLGVLLKIGAVFGPIVAGIVAATTAVVALLASTEKGRGALASLWEAMVKLWNAFRPLFDALAKILAPVLQVVASVARILAAILAPVLNVFAKIIELAAKVLTPMLNVIAFIFEKIAAAIEWVTAKIEALIQKLPAWMRNLLGIGGEEKAAGGKSSAPRHQLSPVGKGFESSESSWKRFQTAAMNTETKNPVVEIGQKQLEEQRRTNEILSGMKPAVTR